MSLAKYKALPFQSCSHYEHPGENNYCPIENNMPSGINNKDKEPFVFYCESQSLPNVVNPERNINNNSILQTEAESRYKESNLVPDDDIIITNLERTISENHESNSSMETFPECLSRCAKNYFVKDFISLYQTKLYDIKHVFFVDNYNEQSIKTANKGSSGDSPLVKTTLKDTETQTKYPYFTCQTCANNVSDTYIFKKPNICKINENEENLKRQIIHGSHYAGNQPQIINHQNADKCIQINPVIDKNRPKIRKRYISDRNWQNFSMAKNQQMHKPRETTLNSTAINIKKQSKQRRQDEENYFLKSGNFRKWYDVFVRQTKFCETSSFEELTTPEKSSNLKEFSPKIEKLASDIFASLSVKSHESNLNGLKKDIDFLKLQFKEKNGELSNNLFTNDQAARAHPKVLDGKEINKSVYKNIKDIPIQKLEIFEALGENDNCNANIRKEYCRSDVYNDRNILRDTLHHRSESEFNINIKTDPIVGHDHKENIELYNCTVHETNLQRGNNVSQLNSKISIATSYPQFNAQMTTSKEESSRKHKSINDNLHNYANAADQQFGNSGKKIVEVVNSFNSYREHKSEHMHIKNNSNVPQQSELFRFSDPREVKLNENKNNDNNFVNSFDECLSRFLSKDLFKSKNIVLDSGDPAILFNRCCFPLTDLRGRKLKNNLGTELLSINSLNELLKSSLLVYDCFNTSTQDLGFNPIKGIHLQGKSEIQVLDMNNEPGLLYNSLGYPLNDEDGSLLYDSQGNLLVILDSIGTPICCTNSEPIFVQDGSLWVTVRDNYNVIHYGKKNLLVNSIQQLKFTNGDNEIKNEYEKEGSSEIVQDTSINNKINRLPQKLKTLNNLKEASQLSLLSLTNINDSSHSCNIEESRSNKILKSYEENKPCLDIYSQSNYLAFSQTSKLLQRSGEHNSNLRDNSVFYIKPQGYQILASELKDKSNNYTKDIYKEQRDESDNEICKTENNPLITEELPKLYQDFNYNCIPYWEEQFKPLSKVLINSNNNLDAWSLRDLN